MTQADIFITTAAELHGKAVKCGKDRAKAGKDKALRAASDEWKSKAFFLAKAYVASLPDLATFCMEDIRAYYRVCRLPEPHHHNCYGGLLAHFKARGLPIVMTDETRPAHSPRTHGKDVALWQVVRQKRNPQPAATDAGSFHTD